MICKFARNANRREQPGYLTIANTRSSRSLNVPAAHGWGLPSCRHWARIAGDGPPGKTNDADSTWSCWETLVVTLASKVQDGWFALGAKKMSSTSLGLATQTTASTFTTF